MQSLTFCSDCIAPDPSESSFAFDQDVILKSVTSYGYAVLSTDPSLRINNLVGGLDGQLFDTVIAICFPSSEINLQDFPIFKSQKIFLSCTPGSTAVITLLYSFT